MFGWKLVRFYGIIEQDLSKRNERKIFLRNFEKGIDFSPHIMYSIGVAISRGDYEDHELKNG